MKRTPVNPWPWSLNFGFNQAEIIEGASRQLVCSGQTSVDADGKPQHAGDMRSQMTLALDNLEAVVNAADMDLTNITRLTVYVTDMDEALKNFGAFGERFGPLGATPPMTLIGATQLAFPGLMIEIEAIAAD
ncbi:RidA family protein [Candidatus Poriferisodalis sp.]|uniref:RidA family protein n=1 Tax=Candidatus Poriferisodalis sp. TaxID=3101277 RepID=UPI003B01FE1F